jgi:CHAT domain-containing protein/tetratricopeptide (TPR) repeat protein
MSSASRVSFFVLTLSLSLISPVFSQSQSPTSTPGPTQASDEETLRTLTEQYGLAIVAGDLEAIRRLWDPQSTNLASRLRFYQGLFSNTRVEFSIPRVTRVEVTGEKAVSQLTTDQRHLDKKTGAVLSERDLFHGACRSYEWIRTGAGWKVEREFSVQEDLAASLDAAASERERDELLEKQRVFVTDTLVGALAARGDQHRVRGDYARALRCHELERAVAEKIGDQAGIAKSWVNFGYVTYVLGDLEQASQFLQKALALYEAAKLRRGVALALEILSGIHLELGDHALALECALRSVRLCKEENNPRRTADALTALALVYENQRNFHQALASLESSLAIAQELDDKVGIAISRHHLASQYHALGEYEQAVEIYRELLKQSEGFGDHAGAAMIRTNIGHVFRAQERYPEALDYYRQALPRLEGGTDKRPTFAVLTGMDGVYLAQGKYSEALPLARRAESLARQIGRQFYIWHALTDLGYCQLGLNRPLEARQSFAEAISIIEKLRSQMAGGPQDRQRYFEQRLDAHHGMLSLLVIENQIQDALVFAERAKARALLDALQQDRVSVQKTMTAEEQQQERRLKSELTRLNTQLTRVTQAYRPDAERVSQIKSQLEKARLNYEAFQNSLYATHPELRVQRGEAPVIKAKELTSLLPGTGTALLEYVVTGDKIYLFAVTKPAGNVEAEVKVYTLPVKRSELARQIEAFRKQLGGRDLGFRPLAIKLHNLLLKPAAAQLRGKTNLVIVPDGTLWDLPFQALLTGTNRFLIQDAAIAYAPSLTVLREMTRRRNNRGTDAASTTLLALGNPLLGTETINRATLTLRSGRLDPLPEAEQEVKALRQLYGPARSKVYIGADAREDRFKKEAGRAGILHFATHGMLNNASPMYSHLALAAGNPDDDGLLEAWELMQLDLKADLAVLSACETARGRFGAGEGMIGLSWAMFIAGVPATVVSQWKVEAAGTRDLMVNFHRALTSQPERGRVNPTKTVALRDTALKVMSHPATRHPFYWAGFVLVGDGR